MKNHLKNSPINSGDKSLLSAQDSIFLSSGEGLVDLENIYNFSGEYFTDIPQYNGSWQIGKISLSSNILGLVSLMQHNQFRASTFPSQAIPLAFKLLKIGLFKFHVYLCVGQTAT